MYIKIRGGKISFYIKEEIFVILVNFRIKLKLFFIFEVVIDFFKRVFFNDKVKNRI